MPTLRRLALLPRPAAFARALLTLLVVSLAAFTALAITPSRAAAQGCIICEDPDVIAPTISVSPADDSHFTSALQAISATACDDRFMTDITVRLNGTVIASNNGFNSCLGASANGTLHSGLNTISVVGCDNSSNCSTETRSVYLDPLPVFSFSVSPTNGSAGSFQGNGGGSAVFTLTNTGTAAGSVSVSASCSGAISGCSGGGSYSLPVGGNATVSVSFSTGPSAGSGTVTITAAGSNGSNISASQSVNVTSPPPVAGVVVTAQGGSISALTGRTTSASFTVQNTSQNTTSLQTFNLQASCSAVVSCSAQSSVDLFPGSSITVVVGVTGLSVGSGSITLSASGPASSSAGVSVTVTNPVASSVSISPSSATLGGPGSTTTLTATVRDAQGVVIANSPVTWSSSATGIATVTNPGSGSTTVTGQAFGTTTITATSGSASSTASVRVGAVTQVVIDAPSTTMVVGSTVQLTAAPRDAGGAFVSAPVTWSSNNAGIATVNSAGLVTGVSPGSVRITAASQAVSNFVDLTITAPVFTFTVSPVNGSAGSFPRSGSGSTTFRLTSTTNAAGTASVSISCGGQVSGCTGSGSYSIGAFGFVDVPVSFATAQAQGAGTVFLTANGGPSQVTASRSVAVTPLPDAITVTADVGSVNAILGRPGSTSFTIHYASDVNTSLTTINLFTSCTAVVSGCGVSSPIQLFAGSSLSVPVSYNGSALGSGTITLTADGPASAAGSVPVTVTQAVPATITIAATGFPLTGPGGQGTLTATVKDASGVAITNMPVTWTSNGPGIATVASTGNLTATVTGQTFGTTSITASVASVSTPVTIKVGAVTQVVIDAPSTTLVVGSTLQLTATPRDAGGVPVSAPVTWSSNNTGIATVNSSGLVTGVSPGSVRITATSQVASSFVDLTITAPVFTFTVSPVNGSAGAFPRSGTGSATFHLASTTNAGGTASVSVSCGGQVSGCTGSGSYPINAFGFVDVPVTFATSQAQGTGTIFLTATGGPSPVSASQSVAVTPRPDAITVTADVGSVNAILGRPGSTSFTIHYTSDVNTSLTTINLFMSCTAVVSGCGVSSPIQLFAGSSLSVPVSFNGGALGSGTITLTADGPASAAGSVPVTVTQAQPATITIVATGFPLNGPTSQGTLTATVKDASGVAITNMPVTWTSNGPGIATVASTGNLTATVTGQTFGTTSITASVASVSTPVTVKVGTVTHLALSAPTTIVGVGRTLQVTAAALNAANQTVASAAVAWSSSNTSLATVSGAGVVTGVSPGNVWIVATSQAVKDSIQLTVQIPVLAFTVSPQNGFGGSFPRLGSGSVQFTLTDTSGVGGSVAVTPSCSGRVSGCPGTSTYTLAPNGSAGVTVPFTTASTTGTGTVSIDAVAGAIHVSGTQSVNVTAAADGITVHADVASVAALLEQPGVVNFTIGFTSDTITSLASISLHVSCSAVLRACGIPSSIQLFPGTSLSVPVSFTGNSAGSGTITVSADGPGFASAAGSVPVTVTQPVPATITIVATGFPLNGPTSQGTLTATVKDANGVAITNLPVTWTSNGPGIATVASTGTLTASVTGQTFGTTSITASVGNVSAPVTVKVGTVTHVALSAPTTIVGVGRTLQLTAAALNAANQTVASAAVAWSSSNTSLATVSGSGLVTGVSPGNVWIVATSQAVKDSIQLTVQIPVLAFTVSPQNGAGGSFPRSGSGSVRFTLTDTSGVGGNVTVSPSCGGQVSGCSGSQTYALAAGGTTNVDVPFTTSAAMGTGIVFIDAVGGATVASAQQSVIVTNAVEAVTVHADAASVAALLERPGTVNFTIGFTSDTIFSLSSITLHVSCPAVLRSCGISSPIQLFPGSPLSVPVSFTGNSVGSGTITVTAEGPGSASAAGSVPVTVTQPVPATITIASAGFPLDGPTSVGTLTATVKDASGVTITTAPVTWTSSATGIATVTNPGAQVTTVTGQAFGTATITATAEAATATFSAKVGKVQDIAVTPASPQVAVGRVLQLTATPLDVANHAVTGASVAWSSSNTAIATVSATGLVTGVAPGVAHLTLTSQAVSKVVDVTVITPVLAFTVSPHDGLGGSFPRSSTGSVRFTLTDTSGVGGNVTVSPSCGGQVSGCPGSQTYALAPGGTTNVDVPFNTSAAMGTGIVFIDAAGGATVESAQQTVTVTHAAEAITIVAGESSANGLLGRTRSTTFTVRLTSDTLFGLTTINLTASCTLPAVNQCAVSSPISIFADGLPHPVLVSFRGNALGSGTIVLSADGPASASASVPVTVTRPVPVSLAIASSGFPLATLASTGTLTATVKDADSLAITDVPVTWTSNGPAIATVASSGNLTASVTAQAFGTTSITASIEGLTKATSIKVGTVTHVALDAPSTAVKVTRTLQATATPLDAANHFVAAAAVSWSSSNAARATVNSSGLITGVSPGNAWIVATAQAVKDSIQVRVDPLVLAFTISPMEGSGGQFPGAGSGSVLFTLTDTSGVGGNVHVIATCSMPAKDCPSPTDYILPPSGSTPVRINFNTAATTGLGAVGIEATSDGAYVAALQTVIVTSPPDHIVVVATTPAVTLTNNHTSSLTFQVTFASDTNHRLDNQFTLTPSCSATVTSCSVSPSTVSLASGVPSIPITVSFTGANVGPGTVTLTAYSADLSASASGDVTVIAQVPGTIIVTPKSRVIAGPSSTGTLTATVKDTGGVVIPQFAAAWTSSATAIATVAASGGSTTVTGQSFGDARITATAGTASDTAHVHVGLVDHIIVTAPKPTLPIGKTMSLTASACDVTDATVPNAVITWSSSNPAVATVSSTGVVTAVAPGSVRITATSQGVSGWVDLTMIAPVFAVNVSPLDGDAGSFPGNATGYVYFNLYNESGVGGTVTVTPSCTGRASYCSGGGTVTLADGEYHTVMIPFTAGLTPGDGTVAISVSGDGIAPLTAQWRVTVTAPVVEAVSVIPSVLTRDVPKGGIDSVRFTVTYTSPTNTQIDNVFQFWPGCPAQLRNCTVSPSTRSLPAFTPTDVYVTFMGESVGAGWIQLMAIHYDSAGTAIAGTARVTVNVHEAVPASITLTPPSLALTGYEWGVWVTATVKDANGVALAELPVTWTSSDSSIATVLDPVGSATLVRAAGYGMATLTATLAGVSATANVEVGTARRIVLTAPKDSVGAGNTLQLTATTLDVAGQPVPAIYFQWSSSDDAIASVSSDGLVYAHAPGTVRITVNAFGLRAFVDLKVTDPEFDFTLTPTSGDAGSFSSNSSSSAVFRLSNTSPIAGTVTIEASCSGQIGACVGGSVVLPAWTSRDVPIAFSTGAAPGTGTVSIVATGGATRINATQSVTVTGPSDMAFTTSPSSVTLNLGSGISLGFTLTRSGTTHGEDPQTASISIACPPIVRYCGVNPTSAPVGPGMSVAGGSYFEADTLGTGTLTLTAVILGESGQVNTASVNVPVNVIIGKVAVIWAGGPSSMFVRDTAHFYASPVDSAGTNVRAPVTWSTSDPAVATVSADGLVTAVAPGTVQIIATAQGVQGSSQLTVQPDAFRVQAQVTPSNVIVPVGAHGFVVINLTNPSGLPGTVVASRVCNGEAVVSCSGGDGSIVLGPGETKPDTVFYVAAPAYTRLWQSSYVGISVESPNQIWAVGGVNLQIPQGITVVATGAPPQIELGATRTVDFAIINNTGSWAIDNTINLSVNCPPVLSGCSVAPSVQVDYPYGGVATVSVTVTGQSLGTGDLTLTADPSGLPGSPSPASGTITVTVSQSTPYYISVSPSYPTLGAIGAQQTLTATVYDTQWREIPNYPVRWTSNDPSIVTVDSLGPTVTATATGRGNTSIIARAGNVTGSAYVSVSWLEKISVTGVTPLMVGDSSGFYATATDSLGYWVWFNGTITWSTSDPTIAVVSSAGMVTGVSPGTARITASAQGIQGSFDVTVLPLGFRASVVADQSQMVVSSGSTGIAVFHITNTSSVAGTATVTRYCQAFSPIRACLSDASPHVIALAPGETKDDSVVFVAERRGFRSTSSIVGVTVAGGPQPVVVYSEVYVTPAGGVVVVAPSTLATVAQGSSTDVNFVVRYSSNVNHALDNTINLSVACSPELIACSVQQSVQIPSGDSAIVTVNVTGSRLGFGSLTLTADGSALPGEPSPASANTYVTVQPLPGATVTIAPQQLSLNGAGATSTLTATVHDANGAVLTSLPVIWSSSNPSAVSVTPNANTNTRIATVTAQGSGHAVIRASIGTAYDSATVDVSGSGVRKITIAPNPPPLPLGVGETVQLVAFATDSAGAPVPGVAFTWNTNQPLVASVNSSGTFTATVTGLLFGKAVITASAQGITSDPDTVTVGDPSTPIASVVALSPKKVTIDTLHGTATVRATVKDQHGVTLQHEAVSWTSSNPLIATVTARGDTTVVTALTFGTITITAVDGAGRDEMTVKVGTVQVVSITPTAPQVSVGANVQLTAHPMDGTGVDVASAIVVWTTSNPNIATVSITGLVHGVATGTATITATSQNIAKSVTVTVGTGGGGPTGDPTPTTPLGVRVRSVNPGTSIERGSCLTIAAGDGAASECGEMRLVHTLPTTVTMGKPRTPTLIYNSAQATGRVLVHAKVTVNGAMMPTTINATLHIDGRGDVSQSFTWDQADTTRTRRITMILDNVPTGAYEYTLQVQALVDNTNQTASVTDTLVAVNRGESPFGAGWWLDGVEHISLVNLPNPTTQRLWIGGDGSTRLYQRATATDSVFVALNPTTRPDTLVRLTSGLYHRLLPGGGPQHDRNFVEFNASGQHARTVNRQQWNTLFLYDNTTCLKHLKLSLPGGQTGMPYDFNYSNACGAGDPLAQLISVDAPSIPDTLRHVQVTPGTQHRITAISGPDTYGISFGYDDERFPLYPTSRVDRLGNTTSFHYAPNGTLDRTTVQAANTDFPNEPAPVHSYRAAEGAAVSAALDSSDVYTLYDGPRIDATDVTKFWLNRFGAPDVVLAANGLRTTITRDVNWPLLAARVEGTDGSLSTAKYDPLTGLLDSSTVKRDAQRTGASSYEWDLVWRAIKGTRTAEGQESRTEYDPLNGDRLSETAIGANGFPDRIVRYHYTPSDHQVDQVTMPEEQGKPSKVHYDALGNPDSVTSPKGFVSGTRRDAIGRVRETKSPIDSAATKFQRQLTTLDIMDRDTQSQSVAPPLSGTSNDVLTVGKVYDAEGQTLSVTRTMTPNPQNIQPLTTHWSYDGAGRKRTETDVAGKTDHYTYDLAGNLKVVETRRGYLVTMDYDATNRMTDKHVPFNVGDAISVNMSPDDLHFEYDLAGRMKIANNQWAHVTRHFNVDGTVADETQEISHADGGFGATVDDARGHVYDLTYHYDRDGRRTGLDYPSMWAPGLLQAGLQNGAQYHYTPFGELKNVTDPLGRPIEFAYDNDGRQRTVTYPNEIVETRHYDDDGRLIDLLQKSPAAGYPHPVGDPTTIHQASLRYDARGKIVWAGLLGTDSVSNIYDGLGQLRIMGRQAMRTDGLISSSRFESQQYDMDPMGNLIKTVLVEAGGTENVHTYDTQTARLSSVTSGTSLTSQSGSVHSYDNAGNEKRAVTLRPTTNVAGGRVALVQTRLTAYDADERPRFVHVDGRQLMILGPQPDGLQFPEDSLTDQETRYDALGRRVWVRTSHLTNECGRWCTVQRFIWDGNQLIGETRYQGGANKNDLTALSLEYDTTTVTVMQGTGPAPIDSTLCGHLGQEPCIGGTIKAYTQLWGRVVYTHGGGIDMPLAIQRVGYGYDQTLLDPLVFYPHANWRGQMTDVSWSSNPSRQLSVATQHPIMPLVADEDIGAYDVLTRRGAPGLTWMGSLMDHSRTETGLEYMRNRYYDPSTGRFTQEDPIGLAGGTNLYGFAAGDPVNFSDPFGLCPPEDDVDDCASLYWAKRANSSKSWLGRLGNNVMGTLAACGESTACGVALDVLSLGGEAIARRAGAKLIEEGIYEFTAKTGKTYVGQSGRISARLEEHIATGKVTRAEAAKATRTKVTGGKLKREIAEQRRIDELGGVGELENVRNPIGEKRRHLMNQP